MRTHTATAALTTLLLALALTSCSSYSAEECQKALSDSSTKTNRPKECQDLSQEDYDVLLMNWALQKSLNGMSKEDRDLLDYSDDGQLNGSISQD